MYSEMLVSQLTEILFYIPDVNIKDIDYAILEREISEETWVHTDRFRYSSPFKDDNERKKHFKNRRIITIVPINSTLKTHDKLIEIFCTENALEAGEAFINNFSLILAGAEKNEYWKLMPAERKCYPTEETTIIKPAPIYFVHMPVDYYETDDCVMCFPKDPLKERPLIEVNTYSTVPNQSIGLLWEREDSNENGEKQWYQCFFRQQYKYLESLRTSLVYAHIKRNSNHFLYYVNTEKFFLENKNNIRIWMEGVSKIVEEEAPFSVNHFHILFCPAHDSNAVFLEYVSRYVFHEAVMVIRFDIEKEYRANLMTKYSSFKLLMRQMGEDTRTNYTIHAHYVDDCIISGRSYRRMLSLAQSILEDFSGSYTNIRICLFDRIFVLIDRNSQKSKLQYIIDKTGKNYKSSTEELRKRYFAYRELRISSIRSHGDSCTICQLQRESLSLSGISATNNMMTYWIKREKNFESMTFKEYSDFKRQKDTKKQEEENITIAEKCRIEEEVKRESKNFRRMYCCHVSNIVIDENFHGNHPEKAFYLIVRLLFESMRYFEADKEESFEYILSYLKIVARPFLVYQKAVKEAVFQLLLLLTEWLLNGLEKGGFSKLTDRMIFPIEQNQTLLSSFEAELEELLAEQEHQRDFLLVCMKQLMELKSNYFIRTENMKKLVVFLKKWSEEDRAKIYERYLIYVKKLIGVGTDTRKSIWFDKKLREIYECESVEEYLPEDIFEILVLENIRAYYDGVERLSNDGKIQTEANISERLKNIRYKDFSSCLEAEGEGAQTVWNSVLLFRFLKGRFGQNEKETDTSRQKYYEIAQMACNILKAQKVYMLLECPLECEQWRMEFAEQIRNLNKGGESSISAELFEQKRDYLIVSASGEDRSVMNIPIHVIKNIESVKTKGRNEYINSEKGFLVWRIGGFDTHPVIVYADFSEHKKVTLLYQCRKLLMMCNMLRKSAFSDNAIFYLYDIVTAENDAIRLSFYKSFSHTPEDIRKQQYSDVVSSTGRQKYMESHVVTLLSDLKISETYRRSLKAEYYAGNLNIKYKKLFDGHSLLAKLEHLYVVDGLTQSHIKIDVIKDKFDPIIQQGTAWKDSLISSEQKVICKNYANGLDELMLLLMALIENAASKGKIEVKEGEKHVVVYLSKTQEGFLRILNEVDTKGDLEKIRFYATRPPQPKDGISIWSMSRYLISLACIVARKHLTDCQVQEKEGNACCQTNKKEEINAFLLKKNVVSCNQVLERLLAGKYEAKVDYIEQDGHIYFSVELPVFAEMYQCFPECVEG